MIKGLIIRTDGRIEETTLGEDQTGEVARSNLKALQEVVGGWIEAFPVTHPSRTRVFPSGTMYLNEEGKLNDLPYNGLATDLVRHSLLPRDVIVGDVIIVGDPDGEGYDTSIPDWIIQKVKSYPDARME